MRGRITKVNNLVSKWGESILTLDGNEPVEELAMVIKGKMEGGYAG